MIVLSFNTLLEPVYWICNETHHLRHFGHRRRTRRVLRRHFRRQKGLNVLVVEQRDEIGVPVRCAEYIPAPLVGKLNLGTGFVVQKVSKMRTLLPDGSATDMAAPGFMIHRDRFDQTLAAEARKQGATFLLSAKAVERTEDGARGDFKKEGVKPCHCAQGHHRSGRSPVKTASWCGVPAEELLPAAQYKMALCTPMDHTEVYLSPDFTADTDGFFQKGRRPTWVWA
jgi:digeranylgeranylglycerophospholipid reductase